MRALTTAEANDRRRRLYAMTPCARAWFYQRELKAYAEGEDAWDEFLKREFATQGR